MELFMFHSQKYQDEPDLSDTKHKFISVQIFMLIVLK